MTSTNRASRQEQTASRLRWLASRWPALLIGGLILAGALAVGGVLREREARALDFATMTEHEAVLGEIEDRMHDELRALERLAGNWERRGGMPRVEFEAEAGEFARDFSFVQAIEWVDTDFYVRWVVPQVGNEEAQDLDLAFEPRRRQALEESRDGRVTTISRPIRLVQGGLGFLSYVPLEVGGRFDGFLVGVFRASDLFSGLLRNVAPGFAVRIVDDGELIYERGASDGEWPRARVAQVRRSPRPWSIEVAPRPEVIATYQTQLPLLMVVGGAALALGFALTAQLARSRSVRNRQLADEMERRESVEQELSEVMEQLPDHVWSGEITPEGFEITYFSPVISRISGHPVGTFDGNPTAWYKIVHKADAERLQNIHRELVTGESDSYDLEYRIYKADGSLGWVRDRVHSSPTKRGRRLDGVASDITEAKRNEEERLHNEKEKLLVMERERITREMHDGLGGQLVSTIAMLERGRSSKNEVTEVLRRALDDMRIVIDSLDPATTDLTTSLGKLRARLKPMLQRNGVALRWQCDDVPGLDDYAPEQTLHLLRIIQEAVINALRHANAGEVSVGIRAGDARCGVLIVEIQDDGCGFRLGAVPGGRGLRYMKSRAEALGAELLIHSTDSGTRIELRVEIPRSPERITMQAAM